MPEGTALLPLGIEIWKHKKTQKTMDRNTLESERIKFELGLFIYSFDPPTDIY